DFLGPILMELTFLGLIVLLQIAQLLKSTQLANLLTELLIDDPEPDPLEVIPDIPQLATREPAIPAVSAETESTHRGKPPRKENTDNARKDPAAAAVRPGLAESGERRPYR